MAFDWTLIKTDTGVGEGDRQYWGYNLTGGAGMVLNVRLRMTVPGGYTGVVPIKGMEKEVYLPGDNTSTFNPGWVLLKNEDLGNQLRRYEYGYATPGGNVLLRQTTEAKVRISNTLRTFIVDENVAVIEGATISGTDVLKDARAPDESWNYLTLTKPSGFTTDFTVLYQFDGTGDTLNDRTTNSLDLSVVSGTLTYAKRNGLIGWAAKGDTYCQTVISGLLQTAGAFTLEVVHVFHAVSSADDILATVRGNPASNLQPENTLWQLAALSGTGQFQLFQEYGAGVNVVGLLDAMSPIGAMQYTVLTRQADGQTCKVYQNGSPIASTVLSNAPDGGTNARLWVAGVSTSSYFGMLFSLRYALAAMTDAQVAESYKRVRGLIAA